MLYAPTAADPAFVVVLLFAMISSKLKQNAPYCHTLVQNVQESAGSLC